MEETLRALQANEARPNSRYGDGSLFPGMRLPLKVKIPEFKIYEGTTDPRHHDMIQLEDPLRGLEEESQDDGVRYEGELWDKHVLAGLRKRARAKRIELAMQRMLLHVHGGVVKLLGGLHVELEATIVHILEIYLEDDPSSKG
ncbi:hypothetical protein CDL15_Pgr009266 [Punica granatum]|uniref:Uncharacterized protein n=1 Tax=Punica granatum TaxID=22663 RepID=A0A218VVJ0_PUNGR|nr:hypothetical protein CDL15_Pgr009266 [Punica granatum]